MVKAVNIADGAVEGCVSFDSIEGVAFEVFLVEEDVYDLVCKRVSFFLSFNVKRR